MPGRGFQELLFADSDKGTLEPETQRAGLGVWVRERAPSEARGEHAWHKRDGAKLHKRDVCDKPVAKEPCLVCLTKLDWRHESWGRFGFELHQ